MTVSSTPTWNVVPPVPSALVRGASVGKGTVLPPASTSTPASSGTSVAVRFAGVATRPRFRARTARTCPTIISPPGGPLLSTLT